MGYQTLPGAWLYAPPMIFDASPRSFAAIAIQVLFWWTVL